MITRWIHRKGHDRLLIFFNGWGMDDRVADFLQAGTPESFSRDVLLCYDYRSTVIPRDVLDRIAGYRERTLVAWSLGVWAACEAGLEGIDRALAINGTLTPVSREEGISPEIFRATLDNYTEKSRERFMRRMCGSSAFFERFLEIAPKRTVSDQKEELASILQNVMQAKSGVSRSWRYTHVFIGRRDTIFPAKAQEYAWRELEPLVAEDMPHFPFFAFSSWPEVCACMEK